MCSICGAPNKEYLCKKCENKLKQIEAISNYTINSDNKVLKRDENSEIEQSKKTETEYFENQIYGFIYEGVIRKLILQYKFGNKPYIYRTFKNFFEKNEKLGLFFKKYDIIVPVPISKKRFKNRGYNQSDLLAKDLAKDFGLEYASNVLIKIIDNKRQSTLSQKQRTLNAKNVYIVKENYKIINKKILLLDDVYTTGATCNECARVLIEAGVKEVGVFTIAKD